MKDPYEIIKDSGSSLKMNLGDIAQTNIYLVKK
jgi:hypothetical protein